MKQLVSMLENAQGPDDMNTLKLRMKQTIFDLEQEAAWKKHLSGEGNRC